MAINNNPNNLHCTPVQQWSQKPKEFIVLNDGDTLTYGMADGVLTLNDGDEKVYKINWYLIDRDQKVKVLCPQEAQAQVDTITTSVLPQTFSGDSVTSSITLEWKHLETRELMTKTYSVTYSTGTTWTESTVTDALVLKINGDEDAIVTASKSSNHLVLTADNAGQGFLTIVKTSIMSVANTTENLINFGRGSDLIEFGGWSTDDGIQDDDDVTYVIIEIPYYSFSGVDQPSFNRESGATALQAHRLWLVVEEGGTAESANLGTTISTGLCAILNGQATAKLYHQVVSEGCPCS